MPDASARTFTAPGPGTWEQDATHCPRPLTNYMFDTFQHGFSCGFKEGTARYGLLFSHLEPALVHNFLYYRPTMVDHTDHAEVGRRFESAQKALESRLWLADLERWDRDVKPDSIRRNRQLEAAAIREFDNDAFIRHLNAVSENAALMVYRHHDFTIPAVLAMGVYVANTLEWTGLDTGVLLAPMKGSSPVSLGAHGEIRNVGAALRESGASSSDYSGMTTAEVLSALSERQDQLGAAVRAYIQSIGLRMAGGYDVADACAIELPGVLVGAIWASREEAVRTTNEGALTRVRDAVPDAHRNHFDQVFQDAHQTSRLRDERGIYNDAWGTGIARQTLLEAGRRLVQSGRIESVDHALEATDSELTLLLSGSGGPAKEELRDRATWRQEAKLNEAPPLPWPTTDPATTNGWPAAARRPDDARHGHRHGRTVHAGPGSSEHHLGKSRQSGHLCWNREGGSPSIGIQPAAERRCPGDFIHLSRIQPGAAIDQRHRYGSRRPALPCGHRCPGIWDSCGGRHHEGNHPDSRRRSHSGRR